MQMFTKCVAIFAFLQLAITMLWFFYFLMVKIKWHLFSLSIFWPLIIVLWGKQIINLLWLLLLSTLFYTVYTFAPTTTMTTKRTTPFPTKPPTTSTSKKPMTTPNVTVTLSTKKGGIVGQTQQQVQGSAAPNGKKSAGLWPSSYFLFFFSPTISHLPLPSPLSPLYFLFPSHISFPLSSFLLPPLSLPCLNVSWRYKSPSLLSH